MNDLRPAFLFLFAVLLIGAVTAFRAWEIRSEERCVPAGHVTLSHDRHLRMCITEAP